MSLKPIIKWAGGKRRLTDKIADAVPFDVGSGLTLGDRLYVEPFIGGGAFWLDIQPKNAIINDKNAELINMYRVVRDDLENLLIALHAHQANDSRDYYNFVRAWDRRDDFTLMTPWQRAGRFIYLNKTGYGGIYRVNKNGKMNVPCNSKHSRNIVNEPRIRALHDYLTKNRIDIRCGDYADTLRNLPANSFVYLDPPYMPVSKTANFTGYTADGFDYAQQVRLRDECVKLRDRGIPFIESNSDTPAVRELYRDFAVKTVQVRRDICSESAKRGTVNELLITA